VASKTNEQVPSRFAEAKGGCRFAGAPSLGLVIVQTVFETTASHAALAVMSDAESQARCLASENPDTGQHGMEAVTTERLARSTTAATLQPMRPSPYSGVLEQPPILHAACLIKLRELLQLLGKRIDDAK
jgi:hypothetical protein